MTDIEQLKQEVETLKAQLQASQKASRMYLQNVAHQLTAPLGAIKWSIEALKDEHVPIHRKGNLLRSVYSQATILVHLIKNFALMSNLDADEQLGQMRNEEGIRERLLFYYHFLTNPEMQELVPESIELAEKLNLSFRVKDYFALAGMSLRQMKRAGTIRDESLCVEETIKLLFRLHGQVYGHSITPAAETDGWKGLMEVKQKRNQLTHPKCADDLEITEEQAGKALVVFLWMRSYLDKIHEIENAKWEIVCEELFRKR